MTSSPLPRQRLALALSLVVPAFAAVAAATSLHACSSSSPATPATPDAADAAAEGPPTLGGLDASIGARAGRLLNSCSGGPESACHGTNAGGMHLPDSPPNLVDVPSVERPDLVRVRRFAPEESYLMLKILGDGGIDGGRMPLGGALDPSDIETFRAWIEAGAPE